MHGARHDEVEDDSKCKLGDGSDVSVSGESAWESCCGDDDASEDVDDIANEERSETGCGDSNDEHDCDRCCADNSSGVLTAEWW